MAEENKSVLRFEDVSIAFEGEPALQNFNLEMLAGETRIVFGAAGSGKSVMLKLALGLLKPDSGRIFLFGQDVTKVKEHDLYEIRHRIGMLFQEGALFDSMTIEENVSYPLLFQGTRMKPGVNGGVPEKVREVLRFVELEHTLEKFPSELSGGMRRRVGIARAAVTEPPLILYDSPTAGLDPITANTIISLIIKNRDTKNTTSAIVTHRYQDGHLLANFRYNPDSGQMEPMSPRERDAARTTFMVLKEGKLVFEGPQRELESAKDPYVAKFKSVKE